MRWWEAYDIHRWDGFNYDQMLLLDKALQLLLEKGELTEEQRAEAKRLWAEAMESWKCRYIPDYKYGIDGGRSHRQKRGGMFVYHYWLYQDPVEESFQTLDEAFRRAWLDHEYERARMKKIVDTETGKAYDLEDLHRWAEERE